MKEHDHDGLRACIGCEKEKLAIAVQEYMDFIKNVEYEERLELFLKNTDSKQLNEEGWKSALTEWGLDEY